MIDELISPFMEKFYGKQVLVNNIRVIFGIQYPSLSERSDKIRFSFAFN